MRIGLHTGEAEHRAGDYYGTAVNRAARLMSVAYGQQILLSHATEQLVRDDLPRDTELVDLGVHRLRDVSSAERIFQVVHPELPEQFPRLRTLDGGASLPMPATSFHGRAEELAKLRALVAQPGCVTLVGTGGVGKTRLAVELAAQAGQQFRDGVGIIDLTTVSADAVPSAVAAGFGLVRRGRRSFRDSIVSWLATKRFLLIIDNCEHVLAGVAPLVRDIAETNTDVTVLCTSRQALGFPGETIFSVRTARLPSSDDPGDARELPSRPALRRSGRSGAIRRGARPRRARPGRPDLPPARRHSAGRRAGGRTGAIDEPPGSSRESPSQVTAPRHPHTRSSEAPHALEHHRMVLRPPHAREPCHLQPTLGLRGIVDGCGRVQCLRRRTERRRRARTPRGPCRPLDDRRRLRTAGNALPHAGDAARLRCGTAGRSRGRGRATRPPCPLLR